MPEPRTYVGPVTVVDHDTVCIGGLNASGECFVRNRVTRSLRVDDCVRVTYLPYESSGPSTALKVGHVDRAAHATECPHQ